MSRFVRAIAPLMVIAAGSFSSTGCGSTNCLATSIDSFVKVDLPSDGWTVERFCLDDDCAALVGPTAVLSVDSTPTTYDLRLDLIDPTGAAFEVATQAETFEYRVNGPDCEPQTANAVIVVADDGSVSVRPLDPAGE